MVQGSTEHKILQAAEGLIQTQGYNAFSYRDLAEIVGIKTSSIHYHFPAKEDLAVAVIQWQQRKMAEALDPIQANGELDAREKVERFLDIIIASTYDDEKKMCLGGMFAADVLSLPESVRQQTQVFFVFLTTWVKAVVEDGRQASSADGGSGATGDFAKHLMLQLEGALLLARLHNDRSYLDLVKTYARQAVG